MENKTKVLFAAFEAAPFIKTGGLGDVAGSLPGSINSDEFEVRVILPKLGQIPEKYQEKMEYVENYTVPLGWRDQYCGLFTLEENGVKYYFLDNEYYFKRDRVYGEFDDAERTAFYSKAVLETILHLDDFKPEIIHCNDWHAALVPIFLREQYLQVEEMRDIRTVYTIHNLKFQGMYDPTIVGSVLGLHGTPAGHQLVYNNAVNYLRAAVIYSDRVTTVSPTYADNIKTPEYGEGLDHLFRENDWKLSGIINGIDTVGLNPKTDAAIPVNFSTDRFTKTQAKQKIKNKLALQKELGLEENADIPLFAMVSRLTSQKGLDMLTRLIPFFADQNMQVAILGTGDAEYENILTEAHNRYPDKIAVNIAFDEKLSRRYYAGADCFLMPSVFEPCGLAQMMAMRYATLPLVRETGGLKDTVDGYADYQEDATGFSFKDANADGLCWAISQALDIYWNNKDLWLKLQKNAAKRDFSWAQSAEKYREMYLELLGK